MIRSRAFQIAIVGLLFWGLTLSSASAKEPDSFVVHEWGTFSTFSGSNGQNLKFYPNQNDLPSFVYNRFRFVKGGLTDALVSLETPVLYFYSDRDRKVSVHVDFPKGVMTDWYPEASRPPSQQLRWDDFRVLAKETPKLAMERKPSRYFAARETDSSYIQTTTGVDKKGENEKFIFYRGIGDVSLPFEVKALGHDAFSVKNTGKHAVPGHFLVNVRDGKVAFKSLGRLSPGTEEKVDLPAEASTAEKLGDAMTALLIEQGLFEKEAKAMVKTWKSDWFGENGTRVLYLVAESVTAEILPLKIDPKPDHLVRVLVGRHDILTPEREVEIDAIVKQLNGDSNAESKVADATLEKLGRYRWPTQSAAEKRLKARDAVRAGR